jgi:hypothetical protein
MPFMAHRGFLAVVAVGIALAIVVIRGPSSGISDVAHEAVCLHLNFFGASIYEYHATTGKWPRQIDDLEKTSLPVTSPSWRSWFDNDAVVIVWHKNLNPDPKENGRHILAYHDKGLIAEGGHKWVCWGDLRTEFIKTEELRAYLQNRKD